MEEGRKGLISKANDLRMTIGIPSSYGRGFVERIAKSYLYDNKKDRL